MTSWTLIGLAAAVVVVVLVWPRLVWLRRTRARHERLAAANGLSAEETAWLWRVARRASPRRPEVAFVRPAVLMTSGPDVDAVMAAQVHDKLFAD